MFRHLGFIVLRAIQRALAGPILFLINPQLKDIRMSISTLVTRLTALRAQLGKVHVEITDKIEELRNALEDSQNLPPEVTEILDAIQEKMDILDDIVPDVVPEEPEPPEDPEPELPGD